MKKNQYLVWAIAALLMVSQSSFSPAPPSLVNDVFHYTNKFRKSKGRAELTMNESLNKIAQKHSEDMAKGRVGFGHSGYDSRSRQAVKEVPGIHSFAENVAYGPNTGKDVVTLWKNSAGHRENMLGRYRFIGIGIAKSRKGVTYYTEVFAN